MNNNMKNEGLVMNGNQPHRNELTEISNKLKTQQMNTETKNEELINNNNQPKKTNNIKLFNGYPFRDNELVYKVDSEELTLKEIRGKVEFHLDEIKKYFNDRVLTHVHNRFPQHWNYWNMEEYLKPSHNNISCDDPEFSKRMFNKEKKSSEWIEKIKYLMFNLQTGVDKMERKHKDICHNNFQYRDNDFLNNMNNFILDLDYGRKLEINDVFKNPSSEEIELWKSLCHDEGIKDDINSELDFLISKNWYKVSKNILREILEEQENN